MQQIAKRIEEIDTYGSSCLKKVNKIKNSDKISNDNIIMTTTGDILIVSNCYGQYYDGEKLSFHFISHCILSHLILKL